MISFCLVCWLPKEIDDELIVNKKFTPLKTKLLNVSKTCFVEISTYSVKRKQKITVPYHHVLHDMCSGVVVGDCLLCTSFVLSNSRLS